jgi:hypothetical protein
MGGKGAKNHDQQLGATGYSKGRQPGVQCAQHLVVDERRHRNEQSTGNNYNQHWHTLIDELCTSNDY